jgi:hypothetical protein
MGGMNGLGALRMGQSVDPSRRCSTHGSGSAARSASRSPDSAWCSTGIVARTSPGAVGPVRRERTACSGGWPGAADALSSGEGGRQLRLLERHEQEQVTDWFLGFVDFALSLKGLEEQAEAG